MGFKARKRDRVALAAVLTWLDHARDDEGPAANIARPFVALVAGFIGGRIKQVLTHDQNGIGSVAAGSSAIRAAGDSAATSRASLAHAAR